MLDYKKFDLPTKPGIYMFKDREENILYVGKALNIRHRVASYFTKDIGLGGKTQLMLSQATAIDYLIVDSEFEALLLEANLIKKYTPRYNVRFVDGKAYPFIKITIKEKYPAVLHARKFDDPKALFFGPYPNVSVMRQVLRIVRRIFPFQSVARHDKKPCLYYHLGLCPCPNVFDSLAMKKTYRKSIRYLARFLEGKKQDVLQDLLKDMARAAKKEAYEEAAKIKKQMEQIQIVTQPFHRPIEYLENPNLVSDQREKEVTQLQKVLAEHGSPVENLQRIECYDISNIQGKQATGSLVVLTNGEIDRSQYRHFRIRSKNTPNDVLMMREILARRLKRTEWDYPGLLVVDGGKAQVSAAVAVLKENNSKLPVIGLAKRLEEIVVPIEDGFKIVQIPLDSPAINILRRIRDEAHRFAIQYHRKLRSKSFMSS